MLISDGTLDEMDEAVEDDFGIWEIVKEGERQGFSAVKGDPAAVD